jgi:hypothetical protein
MAFVALEQWATLFLVIGLPFRPDYYLMSFPPCGRYCITPSLRGHFERVVQGLAPEFHRNCPQFSRHKVLHCTLSSELSFSMRLPAFEECPNFCRLLLAKSGRFVPRSKQFYSWSTLS